MCTAGCGVPVDLGWAARAGRTAHPLCEVVAGAARAEAERAAFRAGIGGWW